MRDWPFRSSGTLPGTSDSPARRSLCLEFANQNAHQHAVVTRAAHLFQLGQGLLYRHPRVSGRGGERFSTRPADPRDYLPAELSAVFQRLAQLGFSQTQVREAALDILHNEEWAPTQPSTQPLEATHEARAEVAAELSAEPQETSPETADNQPVS